MSKERPEETVSLGAGAIWEYPPARSSTLHVLSASRLTSRSRQYKIEPQQQAKRWCGRARCVGRLLAEVRGRALASRDVFDALDAEATGVHQRRVHYLYRDAAAAPCSLEVRRCKSAGHF